MNYITACPACETQFLITKEHLKAYRGKVQCGNCNHVFNAKNRLTEAADDAQLAEESSTNIDDTALVDSNLPKSTEPFVESDSTIIASESEVETESTLSVSYSYTESLSDVEAKPLDEKLNVVLEGVPDLSDLNTIETESDSNQPAFTTHDVVPDNSHNSPYISNQTPIIVPENAIDISASRAPILIEDLTTDPKFQLTKPKRNIWLMMLSFLLFVLASLQTVYFLRTQIAAEYPQYKPYLVQACSYLGCDIKLPQQLDKLSIDDSDMQESDDYQDVIHFSSLLVNNADFTQAYPSIELTLTDAQDKAVLRKLVKPHEYLPENTNAADGLASHQEARIKLAINVHNLSVAGYRVLITY